MEDLESQIAKIQLGNNKRSNSFVYILAEKAIGSDAELYVVAELPLLNPAAEESCEKICMAIGGSLKRAYKRPLSAEVFETAISQINEELGKLASLGQTHWIDKLNCAIAVKDGLNFTIATCGKIAAYLLRGGEFTDISCSPPQSHPLKTFENYASGRIRLDDLTVLSTTQLFNYISMDRFKTILSGPNFLSAAQTIIELLKENAGPEVGFATLLNLQVPTGQTAAEEVDLENYISEEPKTAGLFSKAIAYVKTALAFDRTTRVPKVSLPKIGAPNLKHISARTKNFAQKSNKFLRTLGTTVNSKRKSISTDSIKQLPRLKKILLASAAVLLILVVVNIVIASHYKKAKQSNLALATTISNIQNLLNNAQSSLLYKDTKSAQDDINQAQSKLPAANTIPSAQKGAYDKVLAQIQDLEKQTENNVTAKVTNLGSLAQANNLIKLPGIFATQINGTLLDYNIKSGQIEDGSLKCLDTIVGSVFLKNTSAVIYNGSNLELWDFATGQLSGLFSSSVPAKNDFVNLKLYQTNSRIYSLNKNTNQIISFATDGGKISKPVVANKDTADFSKAQDFAVDGNIYVLTDSNILKFTAGRLQTFQMPFMFKPYQGAGKIYADAAAKNIYILDKTGKRIIVIDKKGTLVETLVSDQFTDLQDFQVDEKGKTIYVLNGSSLLNVTLP